MTQDDQVDGKRKKRPPGDEGALYTRRIAAAIAGRRTELGWSAERLAEEMAAVGVPWTRDVVVNLENGRRKSLAVHELLAVAWVVGVDNPVDLLVPHGERLESMTFPVTPSLLVPPDPVRKWFSGETGPLRAWLSGFSSENEESIRRAVRTVAAERGQTDEKQVEAYAEAIIQGLRERQPPGMLGYFGTPPEGDDLDGGV